MKPLRILAAGLCLALAACEGLSVMASPDGRLIAIYRPPVAKEVPVVNAKEAPPAKEVTADKGSK